MSVPATFVAAVATVAAQEPDAIEVVAKVEVPLDTNMTSELFDPGSEIVSVLAVAGFAGLMV